MRTTDRDAGAERTLSEHAYWLMHRDILSGALAPNEKLRLQGLQERYALGMSPIREALMLLSREGLVSNEGQRGFRVTPVSSEDLQDIVWARVNIETILLAQSIRHGDADWGAEISAAFYKLTHASVPASLDDIDNIEAWESAHRRFHRALLAGAKSPWLHRVDNQLIDLTERYRRIRLARLGFTARTESIFTEHKALMEAALARDVDKACMLLREHVSATFDAHTWLDESTDAPGADPAPPAAPVAKRTPKRAQLAR
ncbi:FCD domain-containing protein [Pandoraea sp.]|uniref:FCD domain-containing protein n=1 Tax=Pandoraea sp. TaxID=1883445 RepID=UPI0035AF7B78